MKRYREDNPDPPWTKCDILSNIGWEPSFDLADVFVYDYNSTFSNLMGWGLNTRWLRYPTKRELLRAIKKYPSIATENEGYFKVRNYSFFKLA